MTLRRCAGHSGLHPSIRARAPVPRTSAAWRLRDARSTHLPSVWPFVFSTLLRPLLTSRADSASSPFQAQGEISPDKSPDLRCTTAGSTPSPLGHWSFAVIGPLALDDTASYPVSVRRLAGSFPTSFPRSVALAQLWFPSLRVASSGEDLHLLVSTHAGRTNLKAFETSLEGLCCLMNTGSTSPRCSRMPPNKLRKNQFATAELRWSAHLGQRAGKARQAGRARRVQRGGIPLCPPRAFLACLALHAPRPVALADF